MFAVKYDTTKTRSQEQQAIDEAALVAINSIHPNSPPSMDTLFDTNSLFIHRVSRPNPYTAPMPFNSSANILNKTGQHVFWATEENRLRTEIGCCGSCSPFEVQVLNQQGHVVIQMSRTGDCSVFCLPCCMPSMRVESPPGIFLGSVQQMCSLFCTKKYAIKSKNGYTVMVLRGPGRCICPKGKIVFKIQFTGSGRQVGTIQKRWAGLRIECFSHDDQFIITFPDNLDPNLKALLLAAIFCL